MKTDMYAIDANYARITASILRINRGERRLQERIQKHSKIDKRELIS